MENCIVLSAPEILDAVDQNGLGSDLLDLDHHAVIQEQFSRLGGGCSYADSLLPRTRATELAETSIHETTERNLALLEEKRAAARAAHEERVRLLEASKRGFHAAVDEMRTAAEVRERKR